MTLTIAIFDDEDQQRKDWSRRLEKLGVGEIVTLDNFDDEVESLQKRRLKARQAGGVEKLSELEIESIFDRIDILIVDYDLLRTTRLTGEEIAYLLRCYSKCGVVVALNQFGATNSFDLTLGGHLESFADLNVGSDIFDDIGLWNVDRTEWKAFRPWSWPVLPLLCESFRKRIADLEEHLEEPILSFLGLDAETTGVLPRVAHEYIQSKGSTPEETTFQSFVTRSTHGLKPRDAKGAIEELIPRIAAARIHRWLECLVLGGQEILVDAPHLVARYPSLLEDRIDQQESWDNTAQIGTAEGLNHEKIRAFAFPRHHWLTRPAWYWSRIRAHEAIPEVADPWSVQKHDWVFCEDTSRFANRSEARGFVAELPTSFSRRYVARVDGVDYHPSVRFSL